MPKKSLEYEGSMSSLEAAQYLEALAASLRAGKLAIESDDALVEMDLGSQVTLEVDARTTSKGRATLGLSLEWRRKQKNPAPTPKLLVRSGNLLEGTPPQT